MNIPGVTEDPIAFGNRSYCSTGKMIMPDGAFHAGSISFYIARLKAIPSISI
jgi:hypothetical protein